MSDDATGPNPTMAALLVVAQDDAHPAQEVAQKALGLISSLRGTIGGMKAARERDGMALAELRAKQKADDNRVRNAEDAQRIAVNQRDGAVRLLHDLVAGEQLPADVAPAIEAFLRGL